MSDKINIIEGSDTIKYKIVHAFTDHIGSDGPLGVAMEGVILILMGLFFACLMPFSWVCEKWWQIYEPIERLGRRARQDR